MVLNLSFENVTIFYDRALSFLWFIPTYMRISLSVDRVVWFKDVFSMCTDSFKTPHGLYIYIYIYIYLFIYLYIWLLNSKNTMSKKYIYYY